MAIKKDSPYGMRVERRLNQKDFWARIGVTQSGGSRYETGRAIPAPVGLLMKLVYGPKDKAEDLLATLRNTDKPMPRDIKAVKRGAGGVPKKTKKG